ncbi:DUF2796 domain-containing protein [Marinobacter sp. M216]|uniref:DUF2796 domain-containing protein n=1 Tax=Marinobacter albus TaxID=3030833 RepID=A0ABT7H958_9GAMM|nr:DUF2796 domain-containing protein [Marinobacter sp. M216]MDK9556477.1 DUF2796 domain-containing protein [Marinobacter sp. M216]
MISGRCLPLLVAPLVITGVTVAADNPGSHQHGHAELQLAISGQKVDLHFQSPAQNLLGFEHRAHTPDQQETIDSVVEWLSETPLINTSSITCILESVAIESEFAGNASKPEHGQHADFEISQLLDCPGLQSAEALTTPLTERFPGLEHLDVAWTGPDGQGAVVLEGDGNRFSLRP